MVPTSTLGYLSPSAYQLTNNVCMIPCGGLLNDTPLTWKSEQLQYYTNYVLNGNPIDSLFKSFIFNGIRTRKSHFIEPLLVGFGEPSEMTDWLQWLDALFDPEANLHALHGLVGADKMDVWISVPYPHPYQASFGVVQGRNLDFQSDIDRFAAVIWWIDQFTSRWMEKSYLQDKLAFKGFLWQRESIDKNDETLVKWINGAIHARGLLSMWLPNYGAAGVLKWQDLGFHVTALHSNYSGNTNFDTNWIKNASYFAMHYHNGIQITLGEGLIYNDTHPLDYFNLGLPDKHNYMKESFLVYQFPNQTLESVYKHKNVDYIRLYTFVKGFYQRVNYPGITY